VLKRLVKGETRGEDPGERESIGEAPAVEEAAVAVVEELRRSLLGEGRW
jgi:hypothetical protein